MFQHLDGRIQESLKNYGFAGLFYNFCPGMCFDEKRVRKTLSFLELGGSSGIPFWASLSRKKMLKESALRHRIYYVCPLCSQHSEICENEVKSGSLVTLNRLFSLMRDLRIFERSERSKSFQELRGAPRNDPRMIQ